MSKRFLGLIATGILLLAAIAPVPAAAEELNISSMNYAASFPNSLSFTLKATAPVEIVDARLHYQVQRQGFAEVFNEVIVKVAPATDVSLSYSLNLRRVGGLPPGVVIDYWWTLYDAGGREYVTEVNKLTFNDERYQWRALSEGLVTLYWYNGSDSFAGQLMATAQQALDKLENDTGARLSEPVNIYIYDSAQSLQGSMVFPQEWTGGVAFTNFNTIAIGIETSSLTWGKRAIVHELAHVVTNQVTANPYNSIPTWLNEGLSMYAEGPLDALYVVFYNSARDQQSLISVRSLTSPFSADPALAYLSYAESYHVVKYLIDTYGQDKMSRFLDQFAEGASADGALEAVYGFDLEGLDAEWQEYAYNAVPDRFQSAVIWTPWLVLLIVLVSGASVIIAVWLFYPRMVRVERVDQ
ncbi:MAG: peptidase MA family metallohydrolase [Dehalogenimonas sp.]|uniref:Peptidase MA family metallohydrolase n=1 Tax=Candidatus Dehalogenimonas loeffleri TaxID=3127115 RepID=A0ABZ2J458_9CHLR|nr:peptidase MA family metallohydrolase [Dehalogenimonas sp.]